MSSTMSVTLSIDLDCTSYPGSWYFKWCWVTFGKMESCNNFIKIIPTEISKGARRNLGRYKAWKPPAPSLSWSNFRSYPRALQGTHTQKMRVMVSTRNSLLRQLTNSKWGAHPSTLRTSALALCFSTAEYACPAWSRSCHARKIDPILNETCRIVTGCIKTTPVQCSAFMPSMASLPLTSAEQSSQKSSAQSRPMTTSTHSMSTLLPKNGSAPGAASWTPLKYWRSPQLMAGLLNGRTCGPALVARQPNGWREASPQTNATLPATINLGLSGKHWTAYGSVKDTARCPWRNGK